MTSLTRKERVQAALAATPQEINDSIDKGLAWLASQQAADGSWPQYGNNVGHTGLALLKFETHATFMGLSPLNPATSIRPWLQKG